MTTRHVPMRSCVGCGHRTPQSSLVRFVAGAEGLVLDGGRHLSGRGGYLHPAPECWERFMSRKPPLRSLRRSVDRVQRAALIELLRDVVAR